jgi:serine/threonine protein kinase
MNLATQTKFTGETTGATPPAPPPLPADIAAKFPQLEIIECLGRGGMGVVYKARQPLLDRLIALKILAPEREKDPQFAERFTREAQALAKLNHPNIVTVYDFGESGGLFYLLMEYVDGVNLRQMIEGKKLASEQALAIVPRICEALQYAHEQGIVHRDIKPENVLLDKQGRVKIADFGIAKLLGVEDGRSAFTKGRQVIGTPFYMAPEQVEHPLEVDHRADIYSLGVVFYEMLTGELPLGRFALPSEKVRIDVRLDEVVLHALEKDPQRRYQQASQIKTDVENISQLGASGTVPLSAGTQPPRVAAPSSASQDSAASPAPAPVPAPASGPSRLSQLAVLGAAWAAAFFALTPPFVMHEVKTHEFENYGPFASAPMFFIFFGLILPVLLAPFGVTILGWVACAQIHRSAGRLHGLWLAAFDGLLFPLIALDGVITFFCYMVLIAVCGDSDDVPVRYQAIFYLSSLAISLVADLLIIWRVWRAAASADISAKKEPDGPGKMASVTTSLVAVFLILLFGIILAIVMMQEFFFVPRLASSSERLALAQSSTAAQKNAIQQELQEKQTNQIIAADLINTREVQASKDRVAIAQAQLSGDAVKIAQAKLTAAQNQLNLASRQYNAGVIDPLAFQAAGNEVNLLRANLAEIQAGLPAPEKPADQNDAPAPPVPAESPVAAAQKNAIQQELPAKQLSQIQDALYALAQEQQTFDTGFGSSDKLQAARNRVAVAEAQLNGDAVKIAAAELKAAQDHFELIEQQGWGSSAFMDTDEKQRAEQAAKSEIEQLEVKLQIAEATGSGGDQNVAPAPSAPAESPATAPSSPVPPSAPAATPTVAPSTPSIAPVAATPPPPPAPPAPDPKAAIDMMPALADQLRSVGDPSALDALLPQFQKWQALLKGTPGEPIANAVMDDLADARAAYAQNDPGSARVAQTYTGTLQGYFPALAAILRACLDQPATAKVQAANGVMWPLWVQLQAINQQLGVNNFNRTGLVNWAYREEPMQKNGPAALAIWTRAAPRFQAWQAMYAGTSAEKVVAALMAQFNELGAALQAGQVMRADVLAVSLYQSSRLIQDALQLCAANPKASTAEIGVAMMGPLQARLQTGFAASFLSLGNDPTAVALGQSLLDETKPALDAWPALFKGTPAEKIAAALVQQVAAARAGFQPDGTGPGPAQLTALVNAFNPTSYTYDFIYQRDDSSANPGLFNALLACVSGPTAPTVAAPAAWTDLLRLRYLIINNALPKAPDTDLSQSLVLDYQAASAVSDWQALFNGTPAEKAANVTAAMLGDLRTALQQNENERVSNLANAVVAQLGNFAQTLRAAKPWPGSSSAAFAAGMTERLRADFGDVRNAKTGGRFGGSNNPDPADRLKQIFAALEKVRPQFTAWQALLHGTAAADTAKTVAKQLADLRDALLQNQDLQAQALGDSLSDNLGLAQSQLLASPAPSTAPATPAALPAPDPAQAIAMMPNLTPNIGSILDQASGDNPTLTADEANAQVRQQFAVWQALLRGTAAEPAVAETKNILDEALADTSGNDAPSLKNALSLVLNQDQDVFSEAAAVPLADKSVAETAPLAPLFIRLAVVEYALQSNNLPLARSLFEQTSPRFLAWQAQFKGTPAAPLSAILLPQLDAVQKAMDAGDTKQAQAQVEVLGWTIAGDMNAFSFPNYGPQHPEFPSLRRALRAALAAPDALHAAVAPAVVGFLKQQLDSATVNSPNRNDTTTGPLYASALAAFQAWQGMLHGSPAEKIAAVIVAQLRDANAAWAQGQLHAAQRLMQSDPGLPGAKQWDKAFQCVTTAVENPALAENAVQTATTYAVQLRFKALATNIYGQDFDLDAARELLTAAQPVLAGWQAQFLHTPAEKITASVVQSADRLRAAVAQGQTQNFAVQANILAQICAAVGNALDGGPPLTAAALAGALTQDLEKNLGDAFPRYNPFPAENDAGYAGAFENIRSYLAANSPLIDAWQAALQGSPQEKEAAAIVPQLAQIAAAAQQHQHDQVYDLQLKVHEELGDLLQELLANPPPSGQAK